MLSGVAGCIATFSMIGLWVEAHQLVVGKWITTIAGTNKHLNNHVVQDVKSVVWHPSGEILASCSYDDSIKLWANDGDEWVCAQTLAGVYPTCLHTSFLFSTS